VSDAGVPSLTGVSGWGEALSPGANILKPDVILVNSRTVLRPLQQASRTIPVVFAQIDDSCRAGMRTG
jgi:hypothetical protein